MMRGSSSAFSPLGSLLLVLLISLASRATACSDTANLDRRHNDLSAKSILDKSIQALGGQSTLEALKTISLHAYIWRSFSIAESNVPGVADTGIVVAGERTYSYDLSDPTTVVQRIDRKDILGDYWTFQRTVLEEPESSLVVKSGQDGYACYTAGNVFLFVPPAAPFGYVDRKIPTPPQKLMHHTLIVCSSLLRECVGSRGMAFLTRDRSQLTGLLRYTGNVDGENQRRSTLPSNHRFRTQPYCHI